METSVNDAKWKAGITLHKKERSIVTKNFNRMYVFLLIYTIYVLSCVTRALRIILFNLRLTIKISRACMHGGQSMEIIGWLNKTRILGKIRRGNFCSLRGLSVRVTYTHAHTNTHTHTHTHTDTHYLSLSRWLSVYLTF